MNWKQLTTWAANLLSILFKSKNEKIRGFDYLSYKGTYHMFIYGYCLTDGVKDLVEQQKCSWFVEVIECCQSEMELGIIQIWTLRRLTSISTLVTARDEQGKVLMVEEAPYTSLLGSKINIVVEGRLMFLPSECAVD